MVSMRSQRKKPPFLSNFLGDKIRKLKVSAVFRANRGKNPLSQRRCICGWPLTKSRRDAFVDDPLISVFMTNKKKPHNKWQMLGLIVWKTGTCISVLVRANRHNRISYHLFTTHFSFCLVVITLPIEKRWA